MKQLASNLGLEVEELRETSHSLIDILVVASSTKIALPINETVMGPVRALWQTLSSLASRAKRAEKKYYVPAKGFDYLFSHPPPGSLVVFAANERDRQVLPLSKRT